MPDLGQKLGLNLCFLKAVYMNIKYQSSTSRLNDSFFATIKSVVLCPTDTVRSALRHRFSFTTANNPAVVPPSVLTRVWTATAKLQQNANHPEWVLRGAGAREQNWAVHSSCGTSKSSTLNLPLEGSVLPCFPHTWLTHNVPTVPTDEKHDLFFT